MNDHKKLGIFLWCFGAAYFSGLVAVVVSCHPQGQISSRPVSSATNQAASQLMLPKKAAPLPTGRVASFAAPAVTETNLIAASGLTNQSPDFVVVPPASPSMPLNYVNMRWVASPDPQARSYWLYYQKTNDLGWTWVDAGNKTNVTVWNLEVGQTYGFFVVTYGGPGLASRPTPTIWTTVPVRVGIGIATFFVESEGYPGKTNIWESSSDLKNWRAVATFVGAPGIMNKIMVTNENQRFFRISAQK